ncbi:hypothetical protein ACA910_017686 [Epithemia clementina (nom. ined.)]
MRSILRDRSGGGGGSSAPSTTSSSSQNLFHHPRPTPLEETASQFINNRRREKPSFLKYGEDDDNSSSGGRWRVGIPRTRSNIHRSREHARQIAQLTLNNANHHFEATTNHSYRGGGGGHAAATAAQPSSKIAAFADFQSAFGATTTTTTTTTNSNNTSRSGRHGQQQQEQWAAPAAQPFDDSMSDASSFYDPQDQFPMMSSGVKKQATNNHNDDSQRQSTRPNRIQQPPMDDFDNASTSFATTDDWPEPTRSTNNTKPTPSPRSMMTMPSNSSMQANFVHIKQQHDGSYHRQTSHSTGSTGSNGSGRRINTQQQHLQDTPFTNHQINGSNNSAAARRRMRQQMRADSMERSSVVSDSSSVHSPNSSHGSLQLQQQQQQQQQQQHRSHGGVTRSANHVQNYTSHNSSSSGAQHHHHPQIQRQFSTGSGSQHSGNGGGNPHHSPVPSPHPYHSSSQQQQQQPHYGNHPFSSSARSVGSTRSAASSATSSNAGATAVIMDLFESTTTGGAHGFTFDAFGLDASQMNAQLNQAMHDLAGSHPEIMTMNGPFLNSSSTVVHEAGSPTHSRTSTPVQGLHGVAPYSSSSAVMYHSDGGNIGEDGFVDGFRVNKRNIHSPSGSTEKSSITSETSSQDRSGSAGSGINLFKERANFARNGNINNNSNHSNNSGGNNRPRIVRPGGMATTSMQPKLFNSNNNKGRSPTSTATTGNMASTSRTALSKPRRPQQEEIEFVDVESDVISSFEPHSSSYQQQQQQQQPSEPPAPPRRPQHFPQEQQSADAFPSSTTFRYPHQSPQQQSGMGRPELKRRPIPNGAFPPPPTSDPGGPGDFVDEAEFGDFSGHNSNAPSESGALSEVGGHGGNSNVPSDVGVNSDFMDGRSNVGSGVRSNVPSDVGVSSDVGVHNGEATSPFHHMQQRRRPDHDSTNIPLQVFSKDKKLRNSTKGSEDTATTVSTGYSSATQQQHQQQLGGQFEEKKEEYENIRSRWESKNNKSPSNQQESPSQPLTHAYLEALQTQYSKDQDQQPQAASRPLFPSQSPRSLLRNNSNNRDGVAAKSEGGSRFHRQPDVVNAAMDRLVSPRNGGAKGQAMSDVGSTPEYLRVKLRRTGVNMSAEDPSPTQSSQGHDSNQENNQPVDSDTFGQMPTRVGSSHNSPKAQPHSLMENSSFISSTSERNKTFRDRREMEEQRRQVNRVHDDDNNNNNGYGDHDEDEDERALERQLLREVGGDAYRADSRAQGAERPIHDSRLRQETATAKQAERDVASLIKRRIAANKRSAEQERQQQQQEAEQEEHQQQRYSQEQSYAKPSAKAPHKGAANGLFEQQPYSPSMIALQREGQRRAETEMGDDQPLQDPRSVMMQVLKARGAVERTEEPVGRDSTRESVLPSHSYAVETKQSIDIAHTRSSLDEHHVLKSTTPKATKMMLNAFLAGRDSVGENGVKPPSSGSGGRNTSGRPALKDDPEYERYFKMLKLGMPMDVVKHAMTRDDVDASVMDGDHNKPAPLAGVPLKDDPEYEKYFRMLKIGMPMDAVKHAMLRDGLDCTVMDQDHNLPVGNKRSSEAETDEPQEKDSHRRARLHWKTLRKVTSNSLWARLDQDISLENIEIDENEFQELFQVEKGEEGLKACASNANANSRSTTVRVIDGKRANNGGIILARLKMSHDEMADAVDRINENVLSAEQIENIIEYLPSKEERRALEAYMLEGGQDAAEKFDGLCECEKFMVSMMTVKHAKRKVRALLFKLQFEQCLDDILQDTLTVEAACDELFNSVRLRQLLGIILTFGNRLNTAGNKKRKAGAFTLDSLLKLNQAKAFDKKTTFLHYVILIVQRNNEILLRFKDDLPTVFKADKVFWDQCLTDLDGVESQLENVRRIALYQARQSHGYRLRKHKSHSTDDGDESLSDGEVSLSLEEEVEALRATPIGIFTLSAIKYVSSLRDKVEETRAKFERLLEYFGEEENTWQPHELFSTIAKFCRDFDKAKDEVLANEKKKQREERKRQAVATAGKPPTHSTPDRRQANQTTPDRRPPEKKMLRASSFQPSISAVMITSASSNKRNATAPPPHAEQEASAAAPQVPLHDDKRRVEPNNESGMLRGHTQQANNYRHPDHFIQKEPSMYQQDDSHNAYDQADFDDIVGEAMLAAVEEEEEAPYTQTSNPGSAQHYEDYEADGPSTSTFTTPTRQYIPDPGASRHSARNTQEANAKNAISHQTPPFGSAYRTTHHDRAHVSPAAPSTERPVPTSSTNPQNSDRNGYTQTQHQSFAEPPAPTNVRSTSLRYKARIKGKVHQRVPPAHSNSAPPDLETTATPFVSVQARDSTARPEQAPTARPEQAPTARPEQAPPVVPAQANYSRQSSNGVDDSPAKLSPRSSFRHRRRMEVRERLRQEKEANQDN